MNIIDWAAKIADAVTICDTKGIILYMNEKSIDTFKKYGGEALIGQNLLDCHPEPSKTKLKELLQSEERNTYTISKNGVKKLIHQFPWYNNTGTYAGLVELSVVLPNDMPHFERK